MPSPFNYYCYWVHFALLVCTCVQGWPPGTGQSVALTLGRDWVPFLSWHWQPGALHPGLSTLAGQLILSLYWSCSGSSWAASLTYREDTMSQQLSCFSGAYMVSVASFMRLCCRCSSWGCVQSLIYPLHFDHLCTPVMVFISCKNKLLWWELHTSLVIRIS